MEFKLTNHKRDHRGFTLVEMMVGVAIGGLLLAALATLYVFSMRSFASMANYSDLNQKSRYASDLLTRDIRSCTNVAAATATQLVLEEPDFRTTYTYDAISRTLNRSKNGETKELLSGVDSLTFALYQPPFTGEPYEKFHEATLSTAKLIGFQWSCSRKLWGTSANNSESLEAAIVEMRNVHVN